MATHRFFSPTRVRFAVGCIVAVAAVLLASPGQAVALECHTRALPNGVKLIVCPDPALTLTAVDVWVRAGSAMEKPDELGAAHVLEHLVFKGTKKRGAGQIDLEMENIGATLNASTSRDWAHFDTTVATDYLDTALDVMADTIQNPAFQPAQVRLETNVIRTEIAGRRMDPVHVLDEALAAELFKGHPYSQSAFGTPEGIEKLTPEILHAFHKRCYTGESLSVIVVGNVDPAKVFAQLTKYFGTVPSGPPNPWPAPATPPTATSVVELDSGPEKTQWMGFAFLGPSMSDPAEVWATDVLSTVLVRRGGGRLHEALVTNGKIAAAVDSGFLTQKLPAMIKIGLAALEGKLDECDKAVEHEIFHLKSEEISASELDLAKRYLLGAYAFEVETAGGLAGSLGFYSIISDYKDSTNYIANIRAVTAKDVQNVARKYLDLNKCVKVRLSK